MLDDVCFALKGGHFVLHVNGETFGADLLRFGELSANGAFNLRIRQILIDGGVMTGAGSRKGLVPTRARGD